MTGFAAPFVETVAPLIPNLSGITSLPYVGVAAKGACAGLTCAGSYAGAFYGLPLLVGLALAKSSYDMYCMKDKKEKKKFEKSVKNNLNLLKNKIVPVAQLAGGLVILSMLKAKK